MATLKRIPITLPDTKLASNANLRDIIGAFFPQEWRLVDPDALTVRYQTCYANISCHVRRPNPDQGTPPSEPLDVFIKLHRASAEVQIFKHLMPYKQEEALVCHEYAQAGSGAAMYGFFQTQDGTFGRVDEFLDARNMVPEDVQDAGIRADVAREFASFHSMNIPSLTLQPVEAFYAALAGGLEKYRGSDRLKAIGQREGIDVVELVNYDFATKIKIVVSRLASISARKAICVHDVNFMNVMVKNAPSKTEGESRVALIDFEFALQNYRAFDIGAHFMQKTFTWSAEKAKTAAPREYTADEMRHFCEAYAAFWNQKTGDSDTGEQVLMESQYGYLLAVAWDVYNMLCGIDDQGEVGGLNLGGLNRLFKEFSTRYSILGLDIDPASCSSSTSI